MKCAIERSEYIHYRNLDAWEQFCEEMERQGEDVENLTEADMEEYERDMAIDRASEWRDVWGD